MGQEEKEFLVEKVTGAKKISSKPLKHIKTTPERQRGERPRDQHRATIKHAGE